MGEPLRLSGTILVAAAVVAAIVGQLPFMDFEAGSFGTATNHEQVWGANLVMTPEGGALPQNETAPTTWHSYYDSALDSARGIGLLRFGGPVLGFGIFVLLAALVLIQGRQTLAGGLTGVAGSFIVGTAILILVIGLGDLNRTPGDPGRFPMPFASGFFVLVGAAILGLAGSLLAIADPSGHRGDDDGPAGGRPVLSVETPDAFNPMKSTDPVPFKPDPPREFREFTIEEPKTFKAKTGPTHGDAAAAADGAQTPPADGAASASKAPDAAADKKAKPAPASKKAGKA